MPASSVERPSDPGLWAHTNHLIQLAPSRRSTGPTGYSPSQIRAAYGVPTNSGAGVVAIVDAFNYPTALNDFNIFASQFGLPVETSTDITASDNSVFQIVYATGTVPPNNADWSGEMALDTQWVHAIAPKAKIILVEAASNAVNDLYAAVNVAKALPGVTQVSMSFGTGETCTALQRDGTFAQPGVVFFAAAGDTPATRDFPAVSKNVAAIGGTTLNLSLTGAWLSESAWSSTGCGASAFEPRPSFQNAVVDSVLGYRGACDLAAVADPNTGVSVYDSYPNGSLIGWLVIGGTSAACPIVAAMENASKVPHTGSQDLNSKLYAEIGSSTFHSITTGNAGGLNAHQGWNFPTGVGTPNGLSGF